jgi:catalase
MKIQKTLSIALLCALPGLALAHSSHDKAPRGPHAEHDRRAQVRAMLERVKEDYPKKYQHLMDLRESDPVAFRMAMRQMLQQKKFSDGGDDAKMQAENQKKREQREDFRQALNDYQSADNDEKRKIRKQLIEMAEDIFDAKQEHRRMKVTKMRKELKRLESEIAERDASRDQHIEEFVDEKIQASQRGR